MSIFAMCSAAWGVSCAHLGIRAESRASRPTDFAAFGLRAGSGRVVVVQNGLECRLFVIFRVSRPTAYPSPSPHASLPQTRGSPIPIHAYRHRHPDHQARRIEGRYRFDVQSRAMNTLRRFLLGQGVARQLLWGFILVTLLSRALMSGAVMLDPDGQDAGSVALCSGRGPLIVSVAGLAARFDASAPVTPANDALALVDALRHDAHADKSPPSGNGDSLCAFGAALFTALASFVALVLLFPAAVRQRFRARFDNLPFVRSIFDDRPPSRAPPAFC
nr:hypothetical protein [Burkholderia pseudomultivorans]